MTYRNWWDAGKAVPREKLIASSAHIRKERRSKTNYLNFHLRKVAKEDQIKSKVSRRKERIRIIAEINEIENRKSKDQSNQ